MSSFFSFLVLFSLPLVFCFLFLCSSDFSSSLALPFRFSDHPFSLSKAICFLSPKSTICSFFLSSVVSFFGFLFLFLSSSVFSGSSLLLSLFRPSIFFLESSYFFNLSYMFSLSSAFCFPFLGLLFSLPLVLCFLFLWSSVFFLSSLLFLGPVSCFSFSLAFCFPFLKSSANNLLG